MGENAEGEVRFARTEIGPYGRHGCRVRLRFIDPGVEEGRVREAIRGGGRLWVLGPAVLRGESEGVDPLVVRDWIRVWVDGGMLLHREDGPAVEWPNGYKAWYRHGEFHREDGPAVERPDGSKEWYRHGLLHREDGPAVEWASGRKEWYRDGRLHREDGPAVERLDGSKEWFRHGLLHREDGPAVEWPNGYKAWWRNGLFVRAER